MRLNISINLAADLCSNDDSAVRGKHWNEAGRNVVRSAFRGKHIIANRRKKRQCAIHGKHLITSAVTDDDRLPNILSNRDRK